ncbi:42845_t:CDS:2, partial [Gigaspora margarita]
SWIGKAKETVEANKDLFIIFSGLISGVIVLKNKIDVLKERQEKEIDILKERQEKGIIVLKERQEKEIGILKEKQEGLRNKFIAILEGL